MLYKTVSALIAGRKLVHIAPDASIRAAARMLDVADVGALAVLEGDGLVGILSERDVICRVVALERCCDRTTVAEVMTPEPITVDAGDSVSVALSRMKMTCCRHLPVLDGDRTVGMLSMRDVPTQYRLMHERFMGEDVA